MVSLFATLAMILAFTLELRDDGTWYAVAWGSLSVFGGALEAMALALRFFVARCVVAEALETMPFVAPMFGAG